MTATRPDHPWRCIVCKRPLKEIGGSPERPRDESIWACCNSGCDMLHIFLTRRAARALRCLMGTYVAKGGQPGRPRKEPLYELAGEPYWLCACCEVPTPQSEMAVDRSWCKRCKQIPKGK